jgi:polysaccharide export outer membrane protein
MLSRRYFGLPLVAALLLLGCANPVRPVSHLADRFAPWTEEVDSYHFLPGDEMDVKLTFNPEFSDRVVVAPDGQIYLALIGGVTAAGRTPDEVAKTVQERYSAELKRPDVSIVPRSFASQMIYVGGEVGRPGIVKKEHLMGVLQAIIGAGGFLSTAATDKIVLIRRSSRDTPMLKVVDANAILNGGSEEHDVLLKRLDVVFVPRSDAAEVGLWIDLNINRILPFSRNFNYTIQRNVNNP